MTHPRWLHALFVGSLTAIVLLVGVAMVREAGRPVTVDQRVVEALDMVDRCETCHDAGEHPARWTEQHPVERFGCTSCHGGQGLATTKEGAHERALDWEWPLRTVAEREAACGTCHLGDQVAGAELLTRGRGAIDERGCAGCHDIPGYDLPDFAPQLDGVKDKVTPGWVRTWLRDPAALNADHRMPVFDLTSEQREALVAFLFSVEGPAIAPVPAELVGDAERGRRAIAYRRCATCHRIEERGGGHAPDLSMAGVKLRGPWLFAYLTDTHRVRPQTRMPGFTLPPEEAADIVAYAQEQWVPDTAEPPWAADEGPVQAERAGEGRKLFGDLGCAGCHRIEAVERRRVAVALTDLGSRRIGDMPLAKAGALPDLPTWIATKARDPHTFDMPGGSPAKMPAFHGMSDEEALAIGVALTALRADPPPANYVKGDGDARSAIPSGETGRLLERYRCLVCHRIGGEGGDISRVPLDGEGSRVQRAWLERFLREPVTLRMDQAERMPVLGITEAEAARLAAWIETSLGDDRVEEGTAGLAPPVAEVVGAAAGPAIEAIPSPDVAAGKAHFARLGCPACHVAEGAGEMKGPVLDGSRERLDPDYVYALLTRGAAVVPMGRHPEELVPAEAARPVTAYVMSLGAPAME